jgi:hypothetical protein
MSNWRLDIKKKFANFMVAALGNDLGKFDSWNSQLANYESEETTPKLAIYFEYSETGEGFPYLLSKDMQQSGRIPIEVTIHIVFNEYSGANQDLAYDYADKITCEVIGKKDEIIHGRIIKVSEVEDINHKANYDYQIAFGFWIKEAVFKAVSSVDASPLALEVDAGFVQPTPPYPAVLDTARAWYDYLNSNVMKDGANAVYNWGDINPEGNDLLQALGSAQPLWTETGILFDGIQQFLKTLPFVLDQPTFIYLVLKQVTWTSSRVFMDGNANGTGRIIQLSAAPGLKSYAGLFSSQLDLTIGTYGILRGLFNNSNSKFEINQTASWSGDAGTNNMGGLTLGSNGNGTANANIEVKGGAIFDKEPTPEENQAIYDYFKTYYNLPI